MTQAHDPYAPLSNHVASGGKLMHKGAAPVYHALITPSPEMVKLYGVDDLRITKVTGTLYRTRGDGVVSYPCHVWPEDGGLYPDFAAIRPADKDKAQEEDYLVLNGTTLRVVDDCFDGLIVDPRDMATLMSITAPAIESTYQVRMIECTSGQWREAGSPIDLDARMLHSISTQAEKVTFLPVAGSETQMFSFDANTGFEVLSINNRFLTHAEKIATRALLNAEVPPRPEMADNFADMPTDPANEGREQTFNIKLIYQHYTDAELKASFTQNQGTLVDGEDIAHPELMRLAREYNLNTVSTETPSEHSAFLNWEADQAKVESEGVHSYYVLYINSVDGEPMTAEVADDLARDFNASYLPPSAPESKPGRAQRMGM